ncbi:MAG: CatA-like O-acetyltransferase [Oscillospiraceae bacterium]|nr:CatA-like O-acetyltransferase [Oscillospiraceae bacterium]
MNYTKIPMDSWKRAGVFRHFIDNLRCVINITADVNVSNLRAFCKERGYRFYPVFIYVVSKAVNSRDEFKMGYDEEGELILWDEVFPIYTVINPETQTPVRLAADYPLDFEAFYQQIIADMESGEKSGSIVEHGYKKRNTFDVSCLPWVHYKSCDLHVFDEGTYLAPFITWGKFIEQNGEYIMPLTMQIHHAVADGFHVSRFFADVESQMQLTVNREG